MTLAELSEEMGLGASDIAVMIAALGQQIDDELAWEQAADLRDVLEMKLRVRNW